MAVWLVTWFDGRFVAWFDGRFLGSTVVWLVAWFVGRFFGWTVVGSMVGYLV